MEIGDEHNDGEFDSEDEDGDEYCGCWLLLLWFDGDVVVVVVVDDDDDDDDDDDVDVDNGVISEFKYDDVVPFVFVFAFAVDVGDDEFVFALNKWNEFAVDGDEDDDEDWRIEFNWPNWAAAANKSCIVWFVKCGWWWWW